VKSYTFHLKANLDDIDFMPNDDITPGTMQPIVFSNGKYRGQANE
jgi:hypothetical protein